MNLLNKLCGVAISSQCTEKIIQISSNAIITVGEIFQFLCGGSGIPTHLAVDFIQIVMLNTVITIFHPKDLSHEILPTFLECTAPTILQRSIGKFDQELLVLNPACEDCLNRNSIFGHRIFNFQRTDISLYHILSKIIKMRS